MVSVEYSTVLTIEVRCQKDGIKLSQGGYVATLEIDGEDEDDNDSNDQEGTKKACWRPTMLIQNDITVVELTTWLEIVRK